MSLPDVMQAAFINATGGPDLIEVSQLPVPRPGPTDVLVRMVASEANHVDRFVRSGAYPTPTPFPFVIGRDVVGVVAEAGTGAAGFRTGDRVWSNSLGHGGRQGAWSEYCVVPTDRLYHLPDDVDPLGAAAVLHGAATAHIGLFRRARLHHGDTLFVGGAAGAVGSALVQMATARGARVVGTASPGDHDWCRSIGVDEVLDHHRPDLMDALRKCAPDGFDIWWDTSGHHDFGACLPLVKQGGDVVVMAGMAGETPLPVGALYTRDLTMRGFAISNASVEDLADAARNINRLLAAGSLGARVAEVLPLAEAARAHRMLEGGVSGRVLVRP